MQSPLREPRLSGISFPESFARYEVSPSRYLAQAAKLGLERPPHVGDPPGLDETFSHARTITVVRSATEVSKSLVKRERNRSTFLASAARGLGSIRCTSSAGALALIEEYSWFTENNKSFGLSERKLEISYSEMIDNPLETVLKLQSFLEINLPRRRTIEISGLIEPR